MAISVQVGQFAKDATNVDNATQDITTTGFDPKAIIMWTSGQTTNGILDQDVFWCYGFSDGTNHRNTSVNLDDGQGGEFVTTALGNTRVLQVYLILSTTTAWNATVAFGTEKFTMTYNTNDSVAALCEYIVYGGSDITGVQVGTITKTTSTAVPVSQTITTDADCQNIEDGKGIVFFIDQLFTSFAASTTADPSSSLSMATSSSREAQYGWLLDDNSGVGEPYQTCSTTKCIISYAGATGALVHAADFVGFNASGFELSWTTSTATAYLIPFMIIKGGQWQVGNDTALTAGTTKDTTTDFTPKGLITLIGRRTSDGSTRQDQSFSTGASDGTNEVSGGCSEEDNNTNVFYGAISSNTKTMIVATPIVGSHTEDSNADATFGTNKFTLDWSNNLAASAWKFMFAVCGDEVGGAANTKRSFGGMFG